MICPAPITSGVKRLDILRTAVGAATVLAAAAEASNSPSVPNASTGNGVFDVAVIGAGVFGV
jgi:opacity protein-like surface antigen